MVIPLIGTIAMMSNLDPGGIKISASVGNAEYLSIALPDSTPLIQKIVLFAFFMKPWIFPKLVVVEVKLYQTMVFPITYFCG